jgi:hypothetical protein
MKQKPHHPPSTFNAKKIDIAALNAFFNIARLWGLKNEEEQILLGNPPRSTFYKWKKEKQGHLSQDTLERISYLLGIYKALQILLPSEQAANEWPRKPNNAPLFNGQSALERMLKGKVIDLADVRRFLDAERG